MFLIKLVIPTLSWTPKSMDEEVSGFEISEKYLSHRHTKSGRNRSIQRKPLTVSPVKWCYIQKWDTNPHQLILTVMVSSALVTAPLTTSMSVLNSDIKIKLVYEKKRNKINYSQCFLQYFSLGAFCLKQSHTVCHTHPWKKYVNVLNITFAYLYF